MAITWSWQSSQTAVDKEIAYRWGQEASAERQRVGSRLQERLEAQRIRVFQGRLGVVQQCDVTEVEIDGRSFWVRPVGSWVLESGNVVAEALAVSLDKPLEWAVGVFLRQHRT